MTITVEHGTAHVEAVPGAGYYLTLLYVDKGHRREGIGSCLMRKVLATVKDGPVFLLASPGLGTDKAALYRFYSMFGFAPISDADRVDMGAFSDYSDKPDMILLR